MKVLRARHFRFDNDDPFTMLFTIERAGNTLHVRVYRLAPNGMADMEADEVCDTLLQAVHAWDTWIEINKHMIAT